MRIYNFWAENGSFPLMRILSQNLDRNKCALSGKAKCPFSSSNFLLSVRKNSHLFLFHFNLELFLAIMFFLFFQLLMRRFRLWFICYICDRWNNFLFTKYCASFSNLFQCEKRNSISKKCNFINNTSLSGTSI